MRGEWRGGWGWGVKRVVVEGVSVLALDLQCRPFRFCCVRTKAILYDNKTTAVSRPTTSAHLVDRDVGARHDVHAALSEVDRDVHVLLRSSSHASIERRHDRGICVARANVGLRILAVLVTRTALAVLRRVRAAGVPVVVLVHCGSVGVGWFLFVQDFLIGLKPLKKRREKAEEEPQ